MNERISALMDGELDDPAAADLFQSLQRHPAAREAWRTYHLIGDALRENAPLSEGFGEKLSRRLAAEPAVMAPGRMPMQPRTWYALAASLAAVALVGWLGFGTGQAPAPLAKAPPSQPQVAVQTKPAVVPLPNGTDDYLLAHQAFSPRLGLQGMAPYVLTVSAQAKETRK
jgi:sigma-E factor negative regulatory protein RseA